MKITKLKIMFIHKEMVQKGKYEEARRLLRFLQEKRITLGTNDVDWYLSTLFEKKGFKYDYINPRSYREVYSIK